MPSSTDGIPSSTKSHCHPERPPTPFMESMIAPEMGLPRMLATGIASMNQATTRARKAAGNQAVR